VNIVFHFDRVSGWLVSVKILMMV